MYINWYTSTDYILNEREDRKVQKLLSRALLIRKKKMWLLQVYISHHYVIGSLFCFVIIWQLLFGSILNLPRIRDSFGESGTQPSGFQEPRKTKIKKKIGSWMNGWIEYTATDSKLCFAKLGH